MGVSSGYPVCQSIVTRVECRVGSFSHPAGKKVLSSAEPKQLKHNIEGKRKEVADLRRRLEQYLREQKTTGLLVLKKDEIFFEQYQYERHSDMQMRSFSMSKTIISILFGIAEQRGVIDSLDDVASKYYQELAGFEYGSTTIRNLLQMSSGVKFEENYSTNKYSDFARFHQRLKEASVSNHQYAEAFKLFNQRQYQQGTRFSYSSIETELLCRLLVRASGSTISEMTQNWLWRPMGAESDGYWLVGGADLVENCGGGFYATLRDYARLGLLLAEDGDSQGQQIIPRDYLLLATDPKQQRDAFKPRHATPYWGYGYLTWIFPMKARTFALIGIYGQSIFVQPDAGIVMVETGVYDLPTDEQAMRKKIQLWKVSLELLGGSSRE